MRHVMSFVGVSVGLTKPYRYQVVELDTLGRVQLWYNDGTGWAVGHGKQIPQDWDAGMVAAAMQGFVTGKIDVAEYNELLPS